MTGGPLNLSLLSRGVGEVQKNGHEKVEVFLEPEDYHNFSKNVDRFYLPPIHSSYPSFLASTPGYTARSSREAQEFRVPKTFTTRKGALLLFSEDLAQRNMERAAKRKAAQQSQHSSLTPSTSLDSQVDLRTVEDLAQSILKYGSHDRAEDKICLKFLHARRDNFERQIRPGFSAKRYLSTWTRTWDDTVFDNVIKQGYITERSLYHYNLVLPHLRRRLFHEDLSHMPQPYRLMRNMLMAPGSLSGYTFYRAPTIELDEGLEDEDEMRFTRGTDRLHSIRVVKTRGGLQEEVLYSDLDRHSQKEVITDLLVKSAVHYALQKQEEIYQESIIRAIQTEQQQNVDDSGYIGQLQKQPIPQQPAVVKAHEFDMGQAVESLLESQHGRLAIGADLPEIDDRSQVSDMVGSFKGSTTLPHQLSKQNVSQRSSWPTELGAGEKEYLGGVPVVSVKEGSAASDASSSHHSSSVPQLPPIRHTLSPIHDVSRETTQPYISLPPIGKDGHSTDPPTVTIVPATPQHSTLIGSSTADNVPSDLATRGLLSRDVHRTQDLLEEDETEIETGSDQERKDRERKKRDHSFSSPLSSDRAKGKASSRAGDSVEVAPPAVGGSSTGTVRSRPQWKAGTRRGPGSVAESFKGSMVMAPDGEIISVGGSVARGVAAVTDVGDLNDVPAGYRLEGAPGVGTDESGASDDEPDEWKNAKKFSISNKSDSLKKVFKRGSASSSSVARSDLERLGSAGKQILWDHASQAASEIDYTSGDIDATMSIHSWSYAVPEHDHELHHATSIHSLPGLQLDGAGETLSHPSSVSEKDIMDTLTDHAQRIAESVLSQPLAGQDLEADVKIASAMWSEMHPLRPLSRAHSVREFRAEAIRIMQDAIEEIMKNRRASSAAPSAAEYKLLIKKSLTTAVAKAAGLDPDSISDDAEISPQLLEALASQKLTPDQIEIVSDAEGRTRIQSRVDPNDVNAVQEGHLFIAPGTEETGGIRRQVSIPADRVSNIDDVEVDRISYQGTDAGSEKGERRTARSKAGSKPGSKAGSIAGGTMADLREMEGMMAELEGRVENSGKNEKSPAEQDDFLAAVRKVEGKSDTSPTPSKRTTSGKTTPSAIEEAGPKSVSPSSKVGSDKASPTLPGGLDEKKAEDLQSVKSGKTGVSQKSVASKDSKKKEKEKDEPFVVGKPRDKKPKREPAAPKKEEKKKKGKKSKKAKKKEEEAALMEEMRKAIESEAEEPPPPPPPVPVVEEKAPPRESSPLTSDYKASSPEFRTDESDGEFQFVREVSSPETEAAAPQTRLQIPSPPIEEEDKSEDEAADAGDDGLKAISNREARAAKRAAAAAKRREEVERRRREKEEQAKREKEEVERQMSLQREMEEERRRREEERRLRKEHQKEAEILEEKEREEAERRSRMDAERERRAKEEYQRKLEEIKRKQQEEEIRRHELMIQRQREEEERRLAEEELMSQMAEQERLEYEKKKKEEEEERKRIEERERLRRIEEAKRAMEEAQRLAEEMARKQAELEARLKFNRDLQVESSCLGHSQGINRAFVFSYFELLQWLGLDIPEFELAKLADY